MTRIPLSREGIQEALEFLNEAVKKRKEDVQDLFADKYADLRKMLNEMEKTVSKSTESAFKRAEEMRAEGERKVKEAAGAIDKKVHESPWPAVGVVSAIAIAVGYLMGRKW